MDARLIFDDGTDTAAGYKRPVTAETPLPIQMRDAASGLAVSFGFTPYTITTKTTTLLKSGPGMCGGIMVSLLGTTDTLTVYDALTATGTPILELVSPEIGPKWLEGANFAIGLCIVTGGTTAGKYNILVA